MTSEDLLYLLKRANKLGAHGIQVLGVQLPTGATQNITDTAFITRHPNPGAATETPWYDT